jgi:hypothetical protein
MECYSIIRMPLVQPHNQRNNYDTSMVQCGPMVCMNGGQCQMNPYTSGASCVCFLFWFGRPRIWFSNLRRKKYLRCASSLISATNVNFISRNNRTLPEFRRQRIIIYVESSMTETWIFVKMEASVFLLRMGKVRLKIKTRVGRLQVYLGIWLVCQGSLKRVLPAVA